MDEDVILRKLAGGAFIRRETGGGYVLGRKPVPEAVVTALFEDSLLRALADGRYDLSALGRARARRQAAPRRGRASRQESFRAQHQVREIVQDEGRAVTVNRSESPLAWLHSRRDAKGRPYIDDAQFAAGERLRCDFELAGLAPSVTAVWSGLPVQGGRRGPRDMTPTEVQVAARQRFNTALDVLGGELADVVMRVCCFLEGLERIEERHGWPVRSGKVVLAIALTRLAAHYGLAAGKNNQIG